MVTSTETVSTPIEFRQAHRLLFTRDVFARENETLVEVLTPVEPGEQVRALVFWDEGLATRWPGLPETMVDYFQAQRSRVELAGMPIRLPGGEAAKTDLRLLETVWKAISEAALCRHSYIIVVGGGAVLDLVGFAAATAHRGIPLVRLPTTSLSQGDGGVGVKNGVNFFGKKNWLGAFTVPHAVINDAAFLDGLPPRERRAGLIEAVKVALIRDARFFRTIAVQAEALAAFETEAFEAVIRESARQHLQHIGTAGDPFERGSARPLDFGHWAAHKLEQLSGFRLGHGEAVAIGMALDLIYAMRRGLLPEATGEEILRLIRQLGFTLYAPELDAKAPDGRRALLAGLDEFREHMGGRLTIPMIRAPGERVDVHEMEPALVEAAVVELRSRHA
jgi:3-dehydroquinate synthase